MPPNLKHVDHPRFFLISDKGLTLLELRSTANLLSCLQASTNDFFFFPICSASGTKASWKSTAMTWLLIICLDISSLTHFHREGKEKWAGLLPSSTFDGTRRKKHQCKCNVTFTQLVRSFSNQYRMIFFSSAVLLSDTAVQLCHAPWKTKNEDQTIRCSLLIREQT